MQMKLVTRTLWCRKGICQVKQNKLIEQTTLIRAIKQITERKFFSRKKKVASTIGVDTHDIEYLDINRTDLLGKLKSNEDTSELKLTVWDFAGQVEYSVNHQVAT